MKNLRFLQFFLVVAFCLGATFVAEAQDETMTNEEVISLTKAGLSKSLIIDKIRTSKSRYDLSTDALIKLKKANIKFQASHHSVERRFFAQCLVVAKKQSNKLS